MATSLLKAGGPRCLRAVDGSGAATSAHVLRQPERDDRKGDEDDQADDVGAHERQHAFEDGGEAHVLDDALDDEYVHSDRRVDEAELDRNDDDDAEPDRIEAERGNDRKDDGHGEN